MPHFPLVKRYMMRPDQAVMNRSWMLGYQGVSCRSLGAWYGFGWGCHIATLRHHLCSKHKYESVSFTDIHPAHLPRSALELDLRAPP